MALCEDSVRPAAQTREWKAIIVLILLIPLLWSPVLLIQFLWVRPFKIHQRTMVPTLIAGDYVLANKLAYGFDGNNVPYLPPVFTDRFLASDPEPGDVVVFYSYLPDNFKRVIGVAGDQIHLHEGRLVINGRPVIRTRLPDVAANGFCLTDTGPTVPRWRERLPNGVSYEIVDCTEDNLGVGPVDFTVPDDSVFVLGDNRDNPIDAFNFTTGVVSIDNVVGRVDRVAFSVNGTGDLRWERILKPVQ